MRQLFFANRRRCEHPACRSAFHLRLALAAVGKGNYSPCTRMPVRSPDICLHVTHTLPRRASFPKAFFWTQTCAVSYATGYLENDNGPFSTPNIKNSYWIRNRWVLGQACSHFGWVLGFTLGGCWGNAQLTASLMLHGYPDE